ncbi:MFS transporter [Chloroflexota bacterium]
MSEFRRSEKERPSPDTNGKSSPSLEKIGTLSSLRIPNFRLLFIGTTLSNAAQWIQQVTLGWLVYDLTASGSMLGTVNLVRSMASLGMIPVAGGLIDRLKRRRLLMIENGWLFAISLALGLLLFFGHRQIAYIFIFSFLAGIVSTIDGNLRQVLVFDLVPRSHTPNAMALIQTGWSLMRSFGPAMGAFLLLWFGAGGNFLVQAGAYVLIVITIIRIQFPTRNVGGVSISPLQNIREGIRYVAKEPVTRAFMLLGFILPLFIIPIYTILPPIYAVEVFGDESGKVLGYLMAIVGLGGIAGGVVTASLNRVERRGLVQLACLFLVSLTLTGFAFSSTLWVALIFLAISGFFEVIFLTTNQTLIQLSIPDELRGRVTSVVNLNAAMSPLGGLIAGIGSDMFGGPRTITIIICSIVAVIAVCVFLGSPTIRNYRLSQAI